MLVGRETELAELAQLVRDVRTSRGRVLCLIGPAGVGKTSLLDCFTPGDVRVLSTRGDPHRRMLSYFGLRQLLFPLVGLMRRLEPGQRRALAPILTPGDSDTEPGASDEFRVGASTLGLLAASAAERPLLVIVDDFHWLDPSSAAALSFAARRIADDAIGVVLVTRDGADRAEILAGLPERRLAGLSREAGLRLIGDRMAPQVALEVVERAGGNPLAIAQALGLLTEEQRRGVTALPRRLPVIDAIEDAYRQRLSGMDPAVRVAVLVVSADEDLDASLLTTTLERLGIPAPGEVLDMAVRSGAIAVSSRVSLVHPLVGSAVYQSAGQEERSAVHTALAGLLRRSDDIERRAWHLGRAATGPDEAAAKVLEQAAASAGARSDHNAMGMALDRAAELSGDTRSKVRRLRAAGAAFASTVQTGAAIAAYDEAIALAEDDLERADIHIERAMPRAMMANPAGACEELLDHSELVGARDEGRAAILATLAAFPAFACSQIHRVRTALARAQELDQQLATSFPPWIALDGIADLIVGEPGALEKLTNLGTMLASTGLGVEANGLADFVAYALAWAGEFDLSRTIIDAMIENLRSVGAIGPLAYSLGVRSELTLRVGRFYQARADAEEAHALGTACGRDGVSGYTLVPLARAEAILGEPDRAREHARASLRTAADTGFRFLELWGNAACGFVELTAGSPDDAIEYLRCAADFARIEGIRTMTIVSWAPDLVEAYTQLGHRDQAMELLERLEAEAGPAPRDLVRALLARCRGLVVDDYGDHFEAALAAHHMSNTPFETARTELVYGERLRRDGRDVEASAVLRRARRGLAEMGAAPWTARAERELASCGDVLEPSDPPALAALTAKEYQVAAFIASGASNQEAASSLFISRRTVESHLASVYRKLGIHSRSQLVHEFFGLQGGGDAQ